MQIENKTQLNILKTKKRYLLKCLLPLNSYQLKYDDIFTQTMLLTRQQKSVVTFTASKKHYEEMKVETEDIHGITTKVQIKKLTYQVHTYPPTRHKKTTTQIK